MNIDNNGESTSKRSVLLVATFAAFLTPFLNSAVNLALPSIGKDLHADAIGLGWVISSFLLSSAIFLLPFGRLAILTSVFQPGERGRAMGISITATYLGLSCGPVIGGILNQYSGNRLFGFFGTTYYTN